MLQISAERGRALRSIPPRNAVCLLSSQGGIWQGRGFKLLRGQIFTRSTRPAWHLFHGWLQGPAAHLVQGTMALPGMSVVSHCFSLDPSPFVTPRMPEMTPVSAPPPDLSHPVSRQWTQRGKGRLFLSQTVLEWKEALHCPQRGDVRVSTGCWKQTRALYLMQCSLQR